MCKTILKFILLLLVSTAAGADVVDLRPDHPNRHVVVKGDTLWDISARFLEDPWKWPEIWQNNAQIDNPHLIFPGDVIVLRYTDDGPVLVVEGPDDGRLSPRIRAREDAEAIPLIPLNAIRQFLNDAVVLEDPEISHYTYVLQGADEHVITGAGDRVYIRNTPETGTEFSIYRRGEAYRDAETNAFLGYEALYLGDGELVRSGDPGTLFLHRTGREIIAGDILLPRDDSPVLPYYQPHVPEEQISGHIIAVVDGVTQIGSLNIVVIDRGTQDGIEVSHLLKVEQRGERVRDSVTGELVRLPRERAGIVMVFRAFEKVSFGIVLTARRAMHVLDYVSTP